MKTTATTTSGFLYLPTVMRHADVFKLERFPRPTTTSCGATEPTKSQTFLSGKQNNPARCRARLRLSH
jgi:hypothetical protein